MEGQVGPTASLDVVEKKKSVRAMKRILILRLPSKRLEPTTDSANSTELKTITRQHYKEKTMNNRKYKL
jgi:hypothetical protein